MYFNFIEISEHDYFNLGKLITERYGLKLPIEKRIMFQARLQSRLRVLNFTSFEEYREFILIPENTRGELEEMIDYVSTNKTNFFRENEHFKKLQTQILPQITEQHNSGEKLFLNCWSAGCSNGQEAFSLAMVLDDFKQNSFPSLNFHILGTDVSRKVLHVAQKGIYPFAESEQIIKSYRKKYLLKSKDQRDPRIKIVNSIRDQVDFCYSNLMSDNYKFKYQFQLIFLRNTLIYFETDIQTQILHKVLKYLEPGGFLFIGHSESLINRNLPIQIIGPSVYQKIGL